MPQWERVACVRTSGDVSVCPGSVTCPGCKSPGLLEMTDWALSCTNHPRGQPRTPTQPTHLLWKHARSPHPTCVITPGGRLSASSVLLYVFSVGLVGPRRGTSNCSCVFVEFVRFLVLLLSRLVDRRRSITCSPNVGCSQCLWHHLRSTWWAPGTVGALNSARNWLRRLTVERLYWKSWNWLHGSLFISWVFSLIVDKLLQPSFFLSCPLIFLRPRRCSEPQRPPGLKTFI